MNELLVAWFTWVNGNYDVLIMTITLLLVGGLVLEVVRLKDRVKAGEEVVDRDVQDLYEKFYGLQHRFTNDTEDQVQVNINVAKDIIDLQKKVKSKKRK